MTAPVLGFLDPIIDPLMRFGFMRYGLAAALIVGVTSSVLSCLLVVRHQALLGDAISHAVLLGVAVGYLIAGSTGIFWGALVVAIAAGMLITYVERDTTVKLDAVLGIVFTGTFALGLAVISVAKPAGIDLFHILFGNVLGVSSSDLALTAVSGLGVLVLVIARFRAFHLWSFDPLMARALGMRTGALEYLLIAMLSATIVASLQAVGLILVIAMLITPGATALLLTTRLSAMMIVASIIGAFSSVVGLYLSFYVNVASGPAIVLVATVCFAGAVLFAPRRGLIAQAVRRRRQPHRVMREDLLKELYDSDDPEASTSTGELQQWLQSRSAPRHLVSRMERDGLVTTAGDGVQLTPGGHGEAVRMIRTHRLLESYAHQAEGIPIPDLHDLAERLEHEVDSVAVADIDRLLGGPDVDPHGHPIPATVNDCEPYELAAIAGRSLSDQPIGAQGRVAMVGDDRNDLLERMVSLGILPQQMVSVVQRQRDALVVRVGSNDLLHVPTEVADRVFVITEG